MMLVATAWVPYMMVCCVTVPFADSTGAIPNCHEAANLSLASAQAASHHDRSEAHSADHASASHHVEPQSAPERTPVHSCCDLTGKSNVTIEKGISFVAQPSLVVTAFLVPDLSFHEQSVGTSILVELHEHSPPIYLKNASFLI